MRFEQSPRHTTPGSPDNTPIAHTANDIQAENEFGPKNNDSDDESLSERLNEVESIGTTILFRGSEVSVSMSLIDCFWNSSCEDNLAFRIQDSLGYGGSVQDRAERGHILELLQKAEPRIEQIHRYWTLYDLGLAATSVAERSRIANEMLSIRTSMGVEQLPEGTYDPAVGLLEEAIEG